MTLSYNQTATYNVSGNILSRNDVGTYFYGETCDLNGQTFTPGPHAVTSVAGVRNASYCYDGGGNMVSGDGRTISYTSFNKPDYIETANAAAQFVYGPSRGILKTVTSSGTGSVTKYSFGAFEKIIKAEQGQTSTRERFSLPGGAVVSFEDGQESSKKEEYLISDAIGSIIATVNALGGVSERYQYDPWGRPRAALNWDSITDLAWNQINRNETSTNKGFSGHEMLDEVGLIHMGGRVYDPTIGRFLSADPVVKGLENTESYNRYSYVLNSPLSFTDPSGYSWLSKTWKKLERSFKKYFREIAVILAPQLALAEASMRYGGKELARFAAKNKFAGEVIGLVGVGACAFITGGTGAAGCVTSYQALTTGSMTYGAGGSIRDAIVAAGRSAALAFANAAAAEGIGAAKLEWKASGFAHAMRGGAFAAITGSDIQSGMVGGFVEGAMGNKFEKWTDGDAGSGTVLAAFTSGTVSEITGGKFAVGALTGAMGYLFNQLSGEGEKRWDEYAAHERYTGEDGYKVFNTFDWVYDRMEIQPFGDWEVVGEIPVGRGAKIPGTRLTVNISIDVQYVRRDWRQYSIEQRYVVQRYSATAVPTGLRSNWRQPSKSTWMGNTVRTERGVQLCSLGACPNNPHLSW